MAQSGWFIANLKYEIFPFFNVIAGPKEIPELLFQSILKKRSHLLKHLLPPIWIEWKVLQHYSL